MNLAVWVRGVICGSCLGWLGEVHSGDGCGGGRKY